MTQAVLQVEHLGKYYKIRYDRRDSYSTLTGTLAESGKEIFRTLLHSIREIQRRNAVEIFKALDDISFEVNPATGTGHRICLRGKTAIPGDVYKNAAFSMPDRLNCAERHKENVTPIPRMILLIRKRVFYD